jgi:membrane protein EpsK
MLYARQDLPGLIRYSQQAVKFLGLTMALPIGIICGFSSSLLSVWLGQKFVSLAPLMSLMTIHLAVNLSVLPLFNIRVATKKVRVPGIVTCVMGVINLGLALLLAGPVGWGMYGVAAAGAIVLTGGNLIFGPWYAAHILGIPRSTFFRETLPNICTTLGLTAACWAVSHYFQIHSWLGLVVGAGSMAVIYFLFVIAFLLNKNERAGLASKLTPYLSVFN